MLGELGICQAPTYVLTLPHGHWSLRWLRTELLEQGFGLMVLLELGQNVGQPVAGRELPQARRISSGAS